MGPTVEMRVLELVCSRLCHELISPVSAVNNGMELLSDGGADMLEEVSDLIASSAAEAAGRLQFYRIAYGLGGAEAPPISLSEARRLVGGLVRDGKVQLDWPAETGESGSDGGLGKGGMKLLLNALALGLDALPRGGRLAVAVEAAPARGATLTAAGKGARIEAATLGALAGELEPRALTARNVHGYFTARVAEAAEGRIETDVGRPDTVVIRLVLPAAP